MEKKVSVEKITTTSIHLDEQEIAEILITYATGTVNNIDKEGWVVDFCERSMGGISGCKVSKVEKTISEN